MKLIIWSVDSAVTATKTDRDLIDKRHRRVASAPTELSHQTVRFLFSNCFIFLFPWPCNDTWT